MLTEFRMPALGADMEAGTVAEWHVAPGAEGRRGDVVAVVETDKGAIDVEIFLDGVLHELVVPVGVRVPVGTVLATVETAESAVGAATEATAPKVAAGGPSVAAAASVPPSVAGPVAAPAGPRETPQQARARVSPAARVLARELGVDVDALHGSGPGGAITREDVQRAAASSVRQAAAPPVREAAEPGGMRAAIAAAMSRSKREIPHYYLSLTHDASRATQWLATHNASVPPAERLIFAALLVKAVALACREVEGFSGFCRDGRYERGDAVHVGVAVALRGGGLVAPAIFDPHTKPLATLMAEFRALVMRARAGRLRASELAAPTIILTSLGDSSVDAVYPIIQPPQVAIVGAGAVSSRPWVVDGRVEARDLVCLSLGADHRVTDGRLGAQFLARIAQFLDAPEQQ